MVKTRLGQILKKLGISTQELAEAIGCSPRSIHNEASKPKSLSLRQRIQAAIGIQVWDDVPITGLIHTFRPGQQLEFSDRETAREYARRLNKIQRGVATVRGCEVNYRRPITVMVSLINPKPDADLIARTADGIQFNQKCELAINLPPKRISPGTEIKFPTVKHARDSIAGLPPGAAKRRGRGVTLTAPATFSETDEQKPTAKTSNRKILGGGTE